MSTLRQATRSSYFHCSRAIPQDESLSDLAVALMVYLLSKPDDWKCEFSDVERRYKWGRDKRRKVFAELEVAGYFERVQGRADGRWEYDLIVHENPLPEDQRTLVSIRPQRLAPSPEKPSTVTPSPEKPSTVRQATTHNIEVHNPDLHNREKQKPERVRKNTLRHACETTESPQRAKLSTHAKELLKICRLPETLSEKQSTDFVEVAKLHEEANHALEEIRQRFGPGGLWYQHFKNGKAVSAPTLWQTWEQWERIEATAKESSSEARDAYILARVDELAAKRGATYQ